MDKVYNSSLIYSLGIRNINIVDKLYKNIVVTNKRIDNLSINILDRANNTDIIDINIINKLNIDKIDIDRRVNNLSINIIDKIDNLNIINGDRVDNEYTDIIDINRNRLDNLNKENIGRLAHISNIAHESLFSLYRMHFFLTSFFEIKIIMIFFLISLSGSLFLSTTFVK